MTSRIFSHSAALLTVLGVLFLAAGPAAAQTCTSTNPSANYGAVDILAGAAWPTTSSFTVTCTGTAGRTVRVCIEFGAGSNVGGSLTQRSLINQANSAIGLNHEVYTNPGHTTVWGSSGNSITAYGTGGTQLDLVIPAGGSVTSAAQTAYSQVLAAQQTVVPGTYKWFTGSPGLYYGYTTGAACPTGTNTTFLGANAANWTATINSNCIVSPTSLDFSSHGLLSANVDVAGLITLQCTNTTPYVVSLGLGLGSGVTLPTARKMTKGAETVTYGLYSDPARAVVWGTGAGQTVSGTGTGIAQNINVYGRVPPQTTPSPGVYTDTVVVTVTY